MQNPRVGLSLVSFVTALRNSYNYKVSDMDKETLQFLDEQVPYIKILKEWFSELDGSSSIGVQNEISKNKI